MSDEETEAGSDHGGLPFPLATPLKGKAQALDRDAANNWVRDYDAWCREREWRA